MTQEHQNLYDEISRLPYEKIGKAISYIRYLEQEAEAELSLAQDEVAELRSLLVSGEFSDSDELLAKIEALPND